MRAARSLLAARAFTSPCPECGATMTGTGTVVHQSDPPRWYVELRCPSERELFTIWTAELQARLVVLLGEP